MGLIPVGEIEARLLSLGVPRRIVRDHVRRVKSARKLPTKAKGASKMKLRPLPRIVSHFTARHQTALRRGKALGGGRRARWLGCPARSTAPRNLGD